VPKMKSRRCVRDRFKVTATGKVLRHSDHTGHLQTKKSSKRKRQLRSEKLVTGGEAVRVKRMMVAL
jgi:large subunit ribosomal protein L35